MRKENTSRVIPRISSALRSKPQLPQRLTRIIRPEVCGLL
jgi:hypothetical protein